MRRPLTLAAVAVVAGLASPALANPLPPNPVHVYQAPDGSVCVTFSTQVPHCTPSTAVTK
ncbi:MAG: hypothetical protein WCD35_02905 [Mycobacteriales bacterium]